MKQVFLFVLFTVWLLILMVGSLLAGFAINEIYLLKPLPAAPTVSVVILKGASLKTVATALEAQRLVSSEHLFSFYMRARHLSRTIVPGTYAIQVGTSMRDIARIITDASVGDVTLVIPEGWSLREIGDFIVHSSVLSGQFNFAKIVGNPPTAGGAIGRASQDFSSDFSFLSVKPKYASLEGFLFPDTYRVSSGEDVALLVQTMLQNFGRRVGSISYDDLILASIVEREVPGDHDRKIVADIFKRRLGIGMALQADSTVNYATSKHTPSISIADTKLDSPYNTYRVRGLPPTPIANPGLSAIEAVRHPQANDFWYFLTDVRGTVHYAKTLEEQSRNREQFLR